MKKKHYTCTYAPQLYYVEYSNGVGVRDNQRQGINPVIVRMPRTQLVVSQWWIYDCPHLPGSGLNSTFCVHMCLGGIVCFLDALSGVECRFSISSRAVSLIGWSNPIGICSNVIDSPSGFHWFAPWHLALRAIWSDVRCQIHIWPAHPAPSVQHNPSFHLISLAGWASAPPIRSRAPGAASPRQSLQMTSHRLSARETGSQWPLRTPGASGNWLSFSFSRNRC